MKMYFAVGSKHYLTFLLMMGVRNILCSYAYPEPYSVTWLLRRNKLKLFADSGAFTAWSKGKEVDIDQYIQWLDDNKEFIGPIANLDVIPGKQGQRVTPEHVEESARLGWENYQYFKSKGIDPMHIFHQGEDYKWLILMLKECKYIGISPSNDCTTSQKREWLKHVFRCIKDINPSIKTHAFGVTSVPLLKAFPFYSADSSSWALTGGLGTMMTPYGRFRISEQNINDRDHFSKLDPRIQEPIRKYVSEIGISMKQLERNYQWRCLVNIRFMLDLEKELNENPVVFDDSQKTLFQVH